MVHQVLVVDDDPLQSRSAQLALEKSKKYSVVTAGGGQEAIDLLRSEKGMEIDLMLLDLSMPEVDGMEVIRQVRPVLPDLPIIIYTAFGDVKKAVAAMREGGDDFIEKQDGPERMEVSVENMLKMGRLRQEVSRLRRVVSGQVKFSDIIGNSAAMQETITLAEKAAKSNISVLVKGESGVGKELFASAIHGASIRSDKPFVAVNCGAIPQNLVESTLFGHEKGAFTGAVSHAMGKFREANGGTLFLDEVGELPLDAQVKLLRVLQQGEVEPVGASAPVDVNVRIISATNRNLKRAVENSAFREDLYYRLNVFPITIPALRDRKEDVADLAKHFCRRYASEENPSVDGVGKEAIQLLSTYHWPGNVRQLLNAVYRATVLCEGSLLQPEDFNQTLGKMFESRNDNQVAPGMERQLRVDAQGNFKNIAQMEEEHIKAALEHYNWRISRVARELNIGRSTLYRKMGEFGISEPGKEEVG